MSFATRTARAESGNGNVWDPRRGWRQVSQRVKLSTVISMYDRSTNPTFPIFPLRFPPNLSSFRGIQLGSEKLSVFRFRWEARVNSVVRQGTTASGGQVRAPAIPSTGNAGVHEVDPPYLKLRLTRTVWHRVFKVSSILFNISIFLHDRIITPNFMSTLCDLVSSTHFANWNVFSSYLEVDSSLTGLWSLREFFQFDFSSTKYMIQIYDLEWG